MVILFTVLTAAYVAISYFEFKEYTVSDCVDYAKELCSLIEDELNAEHIDDYIEKGFDYPGYTDIRSRLGKLRDAYPDIVYLYVYQIREDGSHVVFDLDTEDIPASAPGEVVALDESYRKSLLLWISRVPPHIRCRRSRTLSRPTCSSPICSWGSKPGPLSFTVI